MQVDTAIETKIWFKLKSWVHITFDLNRLLYEKSVNPVL